MTILIYGSLAGGFLSDRWLGAPDPGFAFQNRSLVKYRLIIEDFGGWDLFQELLGAMRRVADRHEADISTVAIRSMLGAPGVAAAIVGGRYADRLASTLRVFSFVVDETDWSIINEIQDRAIGPTGPVYALERDREGPHGRIMKYDLQADGTGR